jgi:hypothetical protein
LQPYGKIKKPRLANVWDSGEELFAVGDEEDEDVAGKDA